MDGWPPLKKAVLVEVGAVEAEGACALRAVRPALVGALWGGVWCADTALALLVVAGGRDELRGLVAVEQGRGRLWVVAPVRPNAASLRRKKVRVRCRRSAWLEPGRASHLSMFAAACIASTSAHELISGGCSELELSAPALIFSLLIQHGPFDDT
jgi:hypothetical protein